MTRADAAAKLGAVLRSWVNTHRRLTLIVAVVLAFGVIGSVTDTEETQRVADGSSVRETDTAPEDESEDSEVLPAVDEDEDTGPTEGKPGNGEGQGRDRSEATPEPQPKPATPRTYLVTRIIDGDTLELATGDVVRVVGIDTPEVGECGFEKAAANLSYLTLDKQVTLTVSDEDRDQYDRLLRYVDVGGLDAGLRLIQNGLAIARYDSRDGYGFHPRELQYVAADKANPGIGCAAPQPLAAVPAQGSACAPGYTPCIPPFPPDMNCDDVDGPIRVTGDDPHGLDADGDGVACE